MRASFIAYSLIATFVLVRVASLIATSDRLTASPIDISRPEGSEVILTSGQDRLPGRAGFDDDFDGVMDNASELGAFGSDDFCLTQIEFDLQGIDDPFARVVSRRVEDEEK